MTIRKTAAGGAGTPRLERGLNLPLLTLYGLGVTIGAGIYVLIGATAARAGLYAPIAFLLAAVVVGFTGLTFAELGTRFPVAAGEAAYVRHGLASRSLSLLVGLMVAASGIVSSAAISLGAATYLSHFIALPEPALVAGLVVLLGLAAAWGIVFSVGIAALMTVIEIGGLLLVIGFGLWSRPQLVGELPRLLPPFDAGAWQGILAAGLLAFFAFTGFEDIANVAEEVKDPARTMPRAILLTLVVSTTLYLAVVGVVVLAVPMERLAHSTAPLALLFETSGEGLRHLFGAIAVIATVNGILVQIIMASRVLYGLAEQGELPRALAYVHPVRRTPLLATLLVVAAVLALALLLPIQRLAEGTSVITLGVFALVNLALIGLKRRQTGGDAGAYRVPLAVPVLGLVTSLAMLAAGLL